MKKDIPSICLRTYASEAILALRLFDIGAIKFGSFDLKNPALSPSPVYLNLRDEHHPEEESRGPLAQLDFEMIAGELFRVIKASGVEYDLISGIPYAGEPISKEFARFLPNGDSKNLKLVKSGKGKSRKISRVINPEKYSEGKAGNRVLLLDDVVSGADSKFEAINALEAVGYEIAALAVLVDREQGGSKKLTDAGYKFICWKTLTDLMDFYLCRVRVSWEEFKAVKKYIKEHKI